MWSRKRARGRVVGALVATVALSVGLVPALTSEAVAGAPASPESGTQRAGDDAEGLTETEALAKAKKTGETVEIASLRGEASEVFATPNGDLEAREYLRPVWTRTGGRLEADRHRPGSR